MIAWLLEIKKKSLNSKEIKKIICSEGIVIHQNRFLQDVRKKFGIVSNFIHSEKSMHTDVVSDRTRNLIEDKNMEVKFL